MDDPLDKWHPQAAGTIIFIFACWGISQLLVALIQLLILIKYNSLIPLACLMIVMDYVPRFMVKLFMGKKVHTEKVPPDSTYSKIFVPLGFLMFWCSLA